MNLYKSIARGGLVLAAIIWGMGFLAVRILADAGMPPSMVLAFRFSIAAIFLYPVFRGQLTKFTKYELVAGFVTGLFLFISFYAQTVGIIYTTPTNNAFFTATNVIMVPFIAWVVYKKRPANRVFAGTVLCLGGTLILTWKGEIGSLNYGDILSLLCAFFFSCHIVCLGYYGKRVSVVKLNIMQMSVAALFSIIAVLPEGIDVLYEIDWASCWWAVFYCGLLSTCVAFFLQTWAQTHLPPGQTAVIMSLESPFCSFFSIMLGYEVLSPQLIIGGIVILVSICVVDLLPGEPG